MAESVQSLWGEIKEQLAEKKQQVIAEINAYPPPIPACDQQFNFLLEERTRLTRLVREADRLSDASFTNAFLETNLLQFIRSLTDFEEEQKENWEEGITLSVSA